MNTELLVKNSTIEKIMVKEVVTISSHASLLEAAKKMDENDIGCIIIIEDNSPVGIVTEKDFLKKVIARQRDLNDSITSIMTTPIISIDKNSDLGDAAALMIKKGIRRLPVVEGSRLVGIVTIRDVLPHYIDDLIQTLDNITEMLMKLR
jgi:CBS domain-containing protein